ncbi:MAG: carbohydrate ABC transporter permease [Armatimonadetes bacterium]|nr:carbohydrate ABC transporter permease [Armatimonadota bacterium]
MKIVKSAASYIVAFTILALFMLPLVWVVLTSFKTRVQVFDNPLKVFFTPTLDNYRAVFASEFMSNMANSFVIAGLSALFSLAVAAPCAFAFSRYPRALPRSDNALFWVLSLRMLPPIAVVVPYYLALRSLGLLDTHLALIVIYSVFNISFAVWLLKGFFDEIPPEIEEAAKVEGWRPLQVFLRVSLPLARSGLVAAGLFCLIQSLNEFLLALLLTSSKAATGPVAISNFQRFFGVDWGQMSAAAVIFMAPPLIFAFLVRNHLVRGMSFGAR